MKNAAGVFFSCGFAGNDNRAGINILRFEAGFFVFVNNYVVNRFFINGSFIAKRSYVYGAFINNLFVCNFYAGHHIFAGSVFNGESAEYHLGSGSTDINTYAQYLFFHVHCLPMFIFTRLKYA